MPLTWIAILPITYYQGKIMKHIHQIIAVLRFSQHGTFIVLSFIITSSKNDDQNSNDNHSDGTILTCKILATIAFLIAYALYLHIFNYNFFNGYKYEGAIRNAYDRSSMSTNPTLKQLLQLSMKDEIVHMYLFGFLYIDDDWQQMIKDESIMNSNISGALNAFVEHNINKVDDILVAIKSCINIQDKHGNTLLHHAARFGCVEYLTMLLKLNPNVNLTRKMGKTPLHHVILSDTPDRIEKLQLLIKANANMNVKDKYGQIPLHLAAMYIPFTSECIDVLIENNVDVNQIDKYGNTALDYVLQIEMNTEDDKNSVDKTDDVKNSTKLLKAGGKRSIDIKQTDKVYNNFGDLNAARYDNSKVETRL